MPGTVHRWTLALEGELSEFTHAATANASSRSESSHKLQPLSSLSHVYKRARDDDKPSECLGVASQSDQHKIETNHLAERAGLHVQHSEPSTSALSTPPNDTLTTWERQTIALFRKLRLANLPSATPAEANTIASNTNLNFHRWPRTLALFHSFPHYHTRVTTHAEYEQEDETVNTNAGRRRDTDSRKEEVTMASDAGRYLQRTSPAPLLELFLQTDGLSMGRGESTQAAHMRFAQCARAVGLWLAPVHGCTRNTSDRDDSLASCKHGELPLSMLTDVALLLVQSGRIANVEEMCDWLLRVGVHLLPICACMTKPDALCTCETSTTFTCACQKSVVHFYDDYAVRNTDTKHNCDVSEEKGSSSSSRSLSSNWCCGAIGVGYGHCCSAAMRIRWRVCEAISATVYTLQKYSSRLHRRCAGDKCSLVDSGATKCVEHDEQSESKARNRSSHRHDSPCADCSLWPLLSFVFYQHVLSALVNSMTCLHNNYSCCFCAGGAHNNPAENHVHTEHPTHIAHASLTTTYAVRHTATVEALLCLCRLLKNDPHFAYATLHDVQIDDNYAERQKQHTHTTPRVKSYKHVESKVDTKNRNTTDNSYSTTFDDYTASSDNVLHKSRLLKTKWHGLIAAAVQSVTQLQHERALMLVIMINELISL